MEFTVSAWGEHFDPEIEQEDGSTMIAVKGWDVEAGAITYGLFVDEDGSYRGANTTFDGMAFEWLLPCEAFAKAVEFGLV